MRFAVHCPAWLRSKAPRAVTACPAAMCPCLRSDPVQATRSWLSTEPLRLNIRPRCPHVNRRDRRSSPASRPGHPRRGDFCEEG